MSYIDGFVIACPEANKQEFVNHAAAIDPMFLEMGALRVVECWGDDVKRGQLTDFYMAVKAEPGEAVQFSWIEWPDKPTRDAGMARITAMSQDPGNVDPRMDPARNPMPFAGQRMIYGGFTAIVDTGPAPRTGFIDGFVIPVPRANQAEYRRVADGSAPIFQDLGASRVVECWADDVQRGKVTDFFGAVKANDDEEIVFSWIEYPDKATRDEAGMKMMDDPRFAALGRMPFDGKRMIVSGFTPVVDISN
jgi:uncharacterized protein YbaA (DUF1428 family)